MTEERQRTQKEQMKAWLCQQIQERKAAEKEQKEAEEAYKAAVIARDARAIQLDQMEKECKKRLELACARYNQALVGFQSPNTVLHVRRKVFYYC